MPIVDAIQCERIADELVAAGWVVIVRRIIGDKIPWIVHATRGDGRRYVVHSDEITAAFVELRNMTSPDAPP